MLAATVRLAFAVCPLVFLVSLIGALIFLFARSKHKMRWMVGFGGVFAFLPILALSWSLMGHLDLARRESLTAEATDVRPQQYETSPARLWTDPPTQRQPAVRLAWQPDNLVEWKADVYSSAESAVEALLAQVQQSLPSAFPELEDSAAQIQFVVRNKGPVDVERILMDRLSRTSRLAPVLNPTSQPARAGVVNVTLHLESDEAKGVVDSRGKRQPEGREIRIHVRTDHGLLGYSARFIEKKWVSHFAEFASLNPTERWITGASHTPCSTQAQAEQQAITNAIAAIEPLVDNHLSLDQTVETGVRAKIFSPAKQQIMRRIENDIRNGGLVSDRFVQSFDRPYGRIWREAILVKMPSQDYFADQAVAVQKIEQASWAKLVKMIGSTVGLVLLICVMYLFLNSVTKGYFVGMLRIGGVVAALVIAAVVILLYME
jgi:hypothetical protein